MSNGGAPYFYDYQNERTALRDPDTIRVRDTTIFWYYSKYYLQKAISVFKIRLPREWNSDFLLHVLFENGYFAVFDSNLAGKDFGTVALNCTLSGYDLYYQPANAVIVNPSLPDGATLRIGKQCELVKLQPNYSGILDIVYRYAELMCLAHETLRSNVAASKLSYIFSAADKACAETFKKLMDDVASGEIAVATGDKLYTADGKQRWDTFSPNLGGNFIAPEIAVLMRKIDAMFDAEVGIPNANTEKRERLNVDEVNANNVATFCKAALWKDTIEAGFERVNEHYGASLSAPLTIEWRVEPDELTRGGESNASASMDIN